MKKLTVILILTLTIGLFSACGKVENFPSDSTNSMPELSPIVTQPIATPGPPVYKDYFEQAYDMLQAAENNDQYIIDNYISYIDDYSVKTADEIKILRSVITDCDMTVCFTTKSEGTTLNIFTAYYSNYYEFQGYNSHKPFASTRDYRFDIFKLSPEAYEHDYYLVDQNDWSIKFLTEDYSTASDDCGFFKNGDVYIMTQYGLEAFPATTEDVPKLFSTKENFPCGKNIDGKNTNRWLLALRREDDMQSYIVIYCEFTESENYYETYIDDKYINTNYKVGILDAHGNLVKSWDTGEKVSMSMYLNPVSMVKLSDSEIEFNVMLKGKHELVRGRFNLDTGVYTSINSYEYYK